ncbi:hypothetical protein [Variovorax sp. EL159]|uniref:hypothetical protein n=1 Tax=Variovorax sp. EL159 TaxID=1566270 RepID=UPI00088B4787|nr:hypothetical protein [Variovorax sp. EL159]SCX72635.1 hypothetical protein SAMN03159363_4357 [Variovorax sp. EL159]
MAKANQLDALAERALDAVMTNKPSLAAWAEDQRLKLAGQPRSEVLAWLVFSLDPANQMAVEEALELDPGDLAVDGPIARVLRA